MGTMAKRCNAVVRFGVTTFILATSLLQASAVSSNPQTATAPSSSSLRSAIYLMERAELRRSNGRLSEALKDYHDALTLHPGLARALLGLSAVRLQLGDVREAKLALEQVLSNGQSDAQARVLAHMQLAKIESVPRRQRALHLKSAIALSRRQPGASARATALMEELLAHYIRGRAYAAALVTARALVTQEPNDDRRTTLAALRLLANTTDTLRSAHPGANATRRAIERLSQHP